MNMKKGHVRSRFEEEGLLQFRCASNKEVTMNVTKIEAEKRHRRILLFYVFRKDRLR